ncbi:MAG TPA: hypothetical protein VI318_21255 [Baekduia sp.]
MTGDTPMGSNMAGDPQLLVASFMEQHEQMLTASRQVCREVLETYGRSLTAVADAQDKLADATEADWLKAVFRAQGNATRDLLAVHRRFADQFLKP